MPARLPALLTVALALVATVSAQDIIHYKFDAGGGMKVINYASRSGIAPAEGDLSYAGSPKPTLWAPGKFGSALAGDPLGKFRNIVVNTGWNGMFTGSVTMAFFLKMRTPITVNGGASFVNCSAGSGSIGASMTEHTQRLTASFGGNHLKTTTKVYPLTTKGWTHLAVVVDDKIGYATFYINGVAEIPQKLSSKVGTSPSRQGMRIGSISIASGSWDIDEFRFRLGTATAAEIKAWAAQNPAADGAYGKGGFPKGRLVLLDSNSDTQGPPKIGNAKYGLELYGLGGSSYILTLGSNRRWFGTMPLPLDLAFLDPALKGVGFESSADLAWLRGAIGGSGKAMIPLPIPNVASLSGFTVYSQAVLYNPTLKRWLASNAFATAIGK